MFPVSDEVSNVISRPFRLIVSQSRVGDRTPHAIPGAAATAALLADQYGLEPMMLGGDASYRIDDWSASLPEASDILGRLHAAVRQALAAGELPLLATNTCSASLATLPAAVKAIPGLKVLWVDAHGDFNTPETTASGYLGGMVLAAACGLWDSGQGAGLDPKQILIAGIRDIDAPEQALLTEAGVATLPPAAVSADAILSFLGDSPVWIHIDWDALEPGHIPAAYKVPGGLLPMQLRGALAAIPPSQIAGIELAEFEAAEDEDERSTALATMLDIVEPLLRPHVLT